MMSGILMITVHERSVQASSFKMRLETWNGESVIQQVSGSRVDEATRSLSQILLTGALRRHASV